MANRSLQLLRNNTVFTGLTSAKSAMSAVTTQDGVAVLGRYVDAEGGKVKTILGIRHEVGGQSGMTFFENSNETSELIAKLQKELDDTQAGAGLNADGTFNGPSGGTWTSGATTLASAIEKLEEGLANISAGTVSGDSKVVIDVTQDKGKITATSANLTGVKLDGYAEGTDADIAATDTLGQALGKLQAQINAMDKAASAEDGKVVTTVAEADGKVTETKANVKDLQLGGYAKTDATGPISGTDTINVALSKLENKANAITIANADGSINVATTASGTDINVNIKSGEHVLAKNGNAGLYTDIKLSSVTPSSTTVKEEYQLTATDGSALGDTIKIYKDSSISKIYLGYSGDSVDTNTGVITSGTSGDPQSLNYVYHKEDGTYEMVHVDVSNFLVESEFASGVTAENSGVVRGVVDPTSETFLTVGADGFKLSGVQDAINTAISGLDVTDDAAVAGQYVAAIEETDGKVAVKTRANVSEAVLNNYTKGSDATAVAATDTVNQAIGKLENQVDAAKAAATTKVKKDAAASHLTLASATTADGSVTYTIGESDIASNTALDGLSAKTVTVIDGSDNDIDVMVSHVAADDGTVKYTISASGNATTIKVGEDIDEGGALSADSTISQALAALYNTAKENKVVGKQAIAVGAPTSGGTEVSLKLDDTKQGTGTEKFGTDNALTQSDGGLFLSTIWDCGNYDVVEP